MSCTESPFSADIAPEATFIAGKVNLIDDQNSDADVYVWMEGVDLGTRTDILGEFRLEIPKELRETSLAQLSGVYKLYFFVANYNVRALDIAVRNGEFVFNHGNLDRNGRLRETVQMGKILDIQTIVDPQWARNDFDGPIDVQVTLRATVDTVMVVFPKSVGGLLGGLLFRNTETGEVFVDIPDVGADTQETVMITQDPVSRRGVFQLNGTNYRDLYLTLGQYEVVPFFFIHHDNLPLELLNSLGEGVAEPKPEFLRIPYRREGGHFRIID